MIDIKQLNKSYKSPENTTTIYKDLNRHVESWSFVCIMWRSGSGKSTLLQLLSGLQKPDTWTIAVNDMQLQTLTQQQATQRRGQNISFVFQQFHLLPHLTVEENILLPVHINKLEQNFDVKTILQKVWISEKINAYPEQLSWWEQQRVAIARAFIAKTPILLADEPTWSLDDANAHAILWLMKELHEETKNTIVMISHDTMAAKYADIVYRVADYGLQTTSI